jgi:hypothetical protein
MKTAVLIILLAIVAFAAVYFVFLSPAPPLSQESAKAFFLEDLQGKYPNADVREVMEILPATASDGSPYFQLKARVTTGLYTPCPERIHVFYDYPPKNFVAQPPEYITRGCRVCLDTPTCILAFPEEAIIASHTYNGTEAVAAFVKGNSDAAVQATALDTYGNHSGVWLVQWSSASSGKGYTVVLSKSANKVLDVVEGAPQLQEEATE